MNINQLNLILAIKRVAAAVDDLVAVVEPPPDEFVANMNMAEIRNVVYAAATH